MNYIPIILVAFGLLLFINAAWPRPPSPLAARVIRQLRLEGWQYDNQGSGARKPDRLVHYDGIIMWVYGGSEDLVIWASDGNQKYRVDLPKWDRHHIWKAYQEYARAHPFRDPLKERLVLEATLAKMEAR